MVNPLYTAHSDGSDAQGPGVTARWAHRGGESAEDAAVREAIEELGSGLGAVSIVSRMQNIPALTGTLVTPVLGLMEAPMSLAALSPCKDEVERVFSRSVGELLATRQVERKEHRGFVYHMPYFGSGEERIWGLTGWITDGVLKFLCPDSHPDPSLVP